MQTGWLILVVAAAGVIITWTLRQNLKDKTDLESRLNRDYRKRKEQEGDTDIDEIKK